MEFNREQIVTALEHCINDAFCDQCNFTPNSCFIHEKSLALIRELTEENEGLRAQVEQSKITIKDLRSRNHEFTRANMSLSRYADELQLELAECTQIKADTVREMQERLSPKAFHEDNSGEACVYCADIDQIAEELLEEAK